MLRGIKSRLSAILFLSTNIVHNIPIDLVMGLIIAELKAQVPASVISDVIPRLGEMMAVAIKREQQSERMRRTRG